MAYQYESKETRVLKTIDSKRYPETNKDFVRNMRRLNSSVDYLASYMRIMQKGVDDANKNFIDQIQGFINDLVVVFSGGEPTGFELGDLKYVFQAVGALFGFSGAPFPINLVDAARHLFDTYIKNLVQLTDVIFDSIEAWMKALIEAVDGTPLVGPALTSFANLMLRVVDNAKDAVDNASDALGRAQEAKDFAQSANEFGLEIVDAGNNIIKNPSFERDMYMQPGTTFSKNYFRTGEQSLKMQSAGGNTERVYHLLTDGVTPASVRVNGSDTYYAEVYVCADDANVQDAAGEDGIQFVFEPLGRFGNALEKQYIKMNAKSSDLKGSWTKLANFIKLPSDAVRLKMSLVLTKDVNIHETYYFDDVTVREVTIAKNAEDLAYEALGITDDIVSAGTNLIKNPGFEKNLYLQPSGSYTNVEAHSGTKSLKMVGNHLTNQKYRFLSDETKYTYIPAAGGDKYYVEFFIKGKASNGQNSGGDNAIQFVIEPFNANNTPLDNQTIDIDADTSLSSSGNWIKVSRVLKLPDTTAKMRLSLQMSSAVERDETYYFDDFIVREVTLASDANDNANTAIDYAQDTVAAGSNIIKNPGFESGLFAQIGGEYTKDQSHSGQRSLKITGNGRYKLLSDDSKTTYIPAAGKDIYYCEFYVFGKGTNNQTSPSTDGIKMLFECYDRSGAGLPDQQVAIDASTDLNSDWTKVSNYVVLPEGTSKMKISLVTSGLSFNETYYFDDIMVREVTLSKEAQEKADNALDFASQTVASGSNIIVNSSFETGLFSQLGGDYNNDHARTGDRSLRMLRGKTYYLLSDDAVFRYIPATGGDIYYCEFYVYGQSGNTQTTGGVDAIRLVIESFDQHNNQLAEKMISTRANIALRNDWNKVSGYIVLPDDTVKMRISLQTTTDVKIGDIYYFDDVMVREVTLAKNAKDVADELADEFINAGSNLVKNPGFEIGWFSQSAGIYTTDQARTGLQSLVMASAGILSDKVFKLQSDDARFRYVPANEGDAFQCEVWVRGKSTNTQTSGGEAGIQILFEPVNTSGNKLEDQIVSMTANNTLNGKWTKLSGTVKMPADTAKVRMNLVLKKNVQFGETYYFDDVMVREVTLADTANTTAGLALSNAQSATDSTIDIIASGSNLIKNSDFERGLSSQLTGTFTGDQYYSGSKSLRMTSTGAEKTYWLVSDGLSPKTIPASAGDVFYCEFYVYGSAGNSQLLGGTGGIRLVFKPTSRFGANLDDAYVGATASTALNGQWTKVSAYVTMPANTAKVQIGIQLTAAVANNEIYYFDAVTVREVTVGKNAQSGVDEIADGVTAAVDGDTAPTGNAPSTVKPKLKSAWAKIWDGHNGTSGTTSKLPSDITTVASSVRSTANSAQTTANTASSTATNANITANNVTNNHQATVDAIVQATDGSTTTNNAHTAPKSKLMQAWANIWDGHNGTSGTTSKLPADITTVASSVRSTANSAQTTANTATSAASTAQSTANNAQTSANTAQTSANTAQTTANTANTNIQTNTDNIHQAVNGGTTTGNALSTVKSNLLLSWARIWDGHNGTTGTTSKLPADITTVASSVRSTANSAQTTANTANTNANNAQTSANTAQTTANTANTNIQTNTDNIHQAVNGGSSTGNALGTVKTNFQLAWARIWDGHNGTSGSTSKLPADITTVAASVRSTANSGLTNAATANTNANNADLLASYVSAANNLVVSPDFEEPSIRRHMGAGTAIYSTDVSKTGTRSLKITADVSGNCLFYTTPIDSTGLTSIYYQGVPGQIYSFDIFHYAASTNTSTAKLYLLFYCVLLDGTEGGYYATSSAGISQSKGAWSRITGTFALPANTVRFRPAFSFGQTGALATSGESIYLDRVLIYR